MLRNLEENTALTDFLAELRQQAHGEVRTDPYSKVLYSTDASIYQVIPLGVLLPVSVEDVHAAVELAAKYQVPILPRAGGSSLAGQAVNEALIIDMSRHLDSILEINREERWVRLQPGVVLDVLNQHLKPLGLQYGPDPASSNRAALGGIVANNSTGAHSILYGMTADHVLETDVILSDGSRTHFEPLSDDALGIYLEKPGLEGDIYRQVNDIASRHAATILAGTPSHWRRCGGYNLDRFIEGASFKLPRDPRFNLSSLITGSEGTLAVMTEIKLNLVPTPAMTALAVVHFDRLHDALAAVPVMLQSQPSAIELLDNMGLTLCQDVPEYARLLSTFIEGSPNCVLITEFYGESEAELKSSLQKLDSQLRSHRIAAKIITLLDPQAQANVWKVRKVGLGLLMSIRGDHKPIPFIEDAAVPVEKLADYVFQIETFCSELGTRVAYYAHASAGCLHIRPFINAKVASDVEKLPVISEFAVSLLGKYGGAFSSEHGDGRARSWLNEKFFGTDLYALFKRVKRAFDPLNLLNPGNVVDAPSMSASLRYGSGYKTIPLVEHLDFRSEMGFSRAIEMCNGAGVCRKTTVDTMCPSFMVTREEEHSTRGRANALRAAMSGLLPAGELTRPRMFQVMDLCIECKACKAECPSAVDMAKIKFEFLAHYYEKHPVPLGTRLFANISSISRLSSGPQAPLINWLLGRRLVRRGMQAIFRIHRDRPLQPFAREPFTAWFRRHRSERMSGANDGKRSSERVVLFNDTFSTFNHPHIAVAATEILEAAGYDVVLPGHRCCGRPMISKGLLHQARSAARDTIDRLAPLANEGLDIVGLEPSCILSIRDEYFALLPDDGRVAAVARRCKTIDEFVYELSSTDRLKLKFHAPVGKILLHGHCHQKAMVGMDTARATLELTGSRVEVLDSGCCGMAGSFGYETEHYVLSLAMAERRLLPSVRSREHGTLVAAAGTSCRQQILDGTGQRALHPVEVLRSALVVDSR